MAAKITLEEVEEFAYEQMNLPIPVIEVLGKPSVAVMNPWLDRTGKVKMTTAEAREYWGEETFNEFVDQAVAYLREQRAEAKDRRKNMRESHD